MEFGLNWTFPELPKMEQPEAEVEEIIEPLVTSIHIFPQIKTKYP